MRVAKREELAVKAHRLALGKLAQDLERFVHPPPAGARIHPTDLKLMRVLAADANAESQPAGGKLSDAGELARHQYRMAQRKKVERHVTR